MDGAGNSFSSDEINFLVYRYLLENGFQHTAFTFGCESNIVNSAIDGTLVPRGALISIIQKGLHFTEAEFFAALATTAADPNDSRIFESSLGTMGLLEAVLPDTERMKILEKKVIDELGPEACARMPPNLRIVEPAHESQDISASSSRISSDVESLDGMEDENDENQNESNQQASTSGTLINSNNLKEEPSFDNRPAASILSHTNAAQFPNTSEPAAPAGLYVPTSSGVTEANGMPSTQFPATTDPGNKMIAAVAPNVQNSYSPNRVFSNGSNNSPNTNAFTSNKLKSALATATRPGVNGTNAEMASAVQLTHRNGKILPNIHDLDLDLELDRNNVIMLKGHQSDVFICSWNPRQDFIASGSGDGTARIWRSPDSFAHYSPAHVETNCIVLNHRNPSSIEEVQADVTSIDWDTTGNFLATGCYDGVARIWNKEGNLLEQNRSHHGPIFALKWNFSGTHVLSAGVDNSTIVWDPKNSKTDKFSFHSSSALDVDWIADNVFASCSVDRTICICQMGLSVPYKTFYGHENEVNAVKFDRVSSRLASCSDDRTLKTYCLSRFGRWRKTNPIYDVRAHEKEIYTIRWSPKGRLIASASFDHSIKIWDVEQAKCSHTLMKHSEPVYTVAFSPDGRCIASGSIDQTTGKVVLTYTGRGSCSGVFEVDWNHRGDRIAASCGDGTLLLFDIRFLKESLH
ncbi:F-box-like/WD repeat-containing protein TBL1XR1 [Aphelenchoides bicaudatus]|nr:F-box-like/WD repeat-containing protein TBL1XR1 [Aphelenchoides bicaudatus]